MLDKDFFEIAQNHFNEALPFVLYKKPNAAIVKGLFQEDDDIYKSIDLLESGFVFSPFDNEKETILIPENKSQTLETTFKAKEEDFSNKDLEKTIDHEAKNNHENLVFKSLQSIESGILQKVVVSRKKIIPLKEKNAITLFSRLLNTYPKAFVYCWYHPKIGLWLGATPETLLTVTGNRFTTMALAGTQKFKGDKNPKWEAKEIEEQQLVTNFIVENLKTSVTNFSVANVETIKAGNLLHLRTKISGILNSNLKTIVSALHPTPAVCGLPKEPAKQFILQHENYNREFYTGFLGELNITEKKSRNNNRRNVENNAYTSIKKVSNLFVNLRCMQLTDVNATIYVGGGITKDSIPEKEWEETVNKTQTMKKVLF